jgi:glycerol dehydrogenase-like iron-containing ADH family enzyme
MSIKDVKMNKPGAFLLFPARIIRSQGALAQLKDAAPAMGKRAFILGGKQALAAAEPVLRDILTPVLTITATEWYGGEVTDANADHLVERVHATQSDLIIAVGGGKALDTGKLAAQRAGCPIITVPTIAATCAATSPFSIRYNNAGHYLDIYHLEKAPDLVVLDPELIAHSPIRWLAAGLGDTLAKFYEYRAITGGHPDFSLNMAAFANSKLCYDIIQQHGQGAIDAVTTQKNSSALEQCLDAIFTYAALTSIMGVGAHAAAAHGIFDGFTVLDKTRHFGHGLLVGFGNLCLLAIENRSDAEIIEAIQLAKACAVPVSLAEIDSFSAEELAQVAAAAMKTEEMDYMPCPVNEQIIIDSMHRVSQLAATLA